MSIPVFNDDQHGTAIITGAALFIFFFNDTATPEINPLSLHAALPISRRHCAGPGRINATQDGVRVLAAREGGGDRKSTRLNSSHVKISYAVFCLKKKKKKYTQVQQCKKKKKK